MRRFVGWLVLFIVCQGTVAAFADLSDLLPSQRKLGYVLRISRTACYRLNPGDYLEVGVREGSDTAQPASKILSHAQILRIHDTPDPNVKLIILALNRREVHRMQDAMARSESSVVLRVVEHQIRIDNLGYPQDDGLEDLNLEKEIPIAENPAP
jgi:hypothetical protein